MIAIANGMDSEDVSPEDRSILNEQLGAQSSHEALVDCQHQRLGVVAQVGQTWDVAEYFDQRVPPLDPTLCHPLQTCVLLQPLLIEGEKLRKLIP